MAPKPAQGRLIAAVMLSVAAWSLFSVLGGLHDKQVLPAGVGPLLALLPRFKPTWLLTTVFLLFHVGVFAVWVRLEPGRIPYNLSMMAFWTFVRTIFFHSGLYFSAHTGMPYLYFLLSKDKTLRRVSLAFSVVMGAGVLFARSHHWIDVLGAYFMTYSIWRLGRRLWARLEAGRLAGAGAAV